MIRTDRRWFVALFAAVALVAAACSSGGGDGGPDDEGAADEGAVDDALAPTPGPEPSGDPVKVGVTTTEGTAGVDLVEFRVGAEVAARVVNEELGGVLGRPVEIVACNDEGDPSAARGCGQQFVDEGVTAVMAFSPVWGDNGLVLTAEAGIPFVGVALSNAAIIDPTTRPFAGASLSAFPALSTFAIDSGEVERAAVLYADLGAGELAANALIADFFREAGIDVELVPETIGASDFTSAVAAADAGDPDAIFILFDVEDCARIMDAALQLGVDAAIYQASCETDLWSPGVLEAFTVVESDDFDWQGDTPDAELYRDRVPRYADADADGAYASGYAILRSLVDAIEAVGSDDPAALLDALSTENQPIHMGTETDQSRCAQLAGVQTTTCAVDVRIIVFEDGTPTDQGDWFSAF